MVFRQGLPTTQMEISQLLTALSSHLELGVLIDCKLLHLTHTQTLEVLIQIRILTQEI